MKLITLKSILVFLVLLISCQIGFSAIRIVKPNNSIQESIQKASEGDTLLIASGIYSEHNILLKKYLHLIGEKGAIIDAQFKGNVFQIETEQFSIANLELINVGVSYTEEFAAIKVVRANQFTIEQCVIKQAFFGILIEKSKNGIIRNNSISSTLKNEAGSGNGIHIWSGEKMTIQNNELQGLRDGIYFEFVNNSVIFNNSSHNNLRYGLHFMFSNSNEYHHNTFTNNGSGVAVMFSKNIVMKHNNFQYNWGSASYGLLLKEIYDATIEENTFEQNTIGINIEGTSRIIYLRNQFIRNGWAIKIAGACYSNNFTENDFLHNVLDVSYNSKENDNSFNKNYWSEYSGYDLNKDNIGDVPYRPVKLFAFIVNRSPEALILLRSLFIDIINFSEKVSPIFTPSHVVDATPLIRSVHD